MSKVIIFPNARGGVAILFPAANCAIPLNEIGRKDVPAGTPYIILDESDVPVDQTFFEAFEADFSNPHGVGIGARAWFLEQYQAEVAAISSAAVPALVEGQSQEEYAGTIAFWEQRKTVRLNELAAMIAVQQVEMQA